MASSSEHNPLAWALAVRMKRGRLSKAVVALRCLARILRARLSDMKKELLLDCVKTYATLNEMEQAEMKAMMETKEYKDVREENLTYFGRVRLEGYKEGQKEGRKEERLTMIRQLQEKLITASRDRFGEDELGWQRVREIEDPDILLDLLLQVPLARSLAEVLDRGGSRNV